MTDVAVVIPNHDGMEILPDCLDAVLGQDVLPDEVVVVDDASRDDSRGMLARRYPDVRVVALATNRGFAGAANRGVAAVTAERAVILNSDARPHPGWMSALLAAPRPATAWAWGSVLLQPGGALVESAGDLYRPTGVATKWLRDAPVGEVPELPYDVFAPPGAALMVRTDAFRELGGYDERYRLYYEDVDLAFRARRRGWRVVMVPDARVEHLLGATTQRRWQRAVFHIGRNTWWCAAGNLPRLPVRDLLRGTRAQFRWARARGAGAAFVAGRAASLPRTVWLRRRRPTTSPGALLLVGDVPGPTWVADHEDELE